MEMHLVLNIFVGERKTIRASMNIYDKGSHELWREFGFILKLNKPLLLYYLQQQ